MKNFIKKFFSYLSLFIFLNQSIMIQVMAMSGDDDLKVSSSTSPSKLPVTKVGAEDSEDSDCLHEELSMISLIKLIFEKIEELSEGKSKEAVIKEILDIQDLSIKYNILTALLPKFYADRLTSSNFESYLNLMKEIREKSPLCETSVALLCSKVQRVSSSCDEKLTEDQWSLLLREILQTTDECLEAGAPLFFTKMEQIYSHMSELSLAPYDDEVIKKLYMYYHLIDFNPFMPLVPPHIRPDKACLKLFLSILKGGKFKGLKPLKREGPVSCREGYYPPYFESLLSRKGARKKTLPSVDEDESSQQVTTLSAHNSLLDFSNIPPELWLEIFSFLPVEDGLSTLWRVNQGVAFLLEQSLRDIHINGQKSQKPGEKVNIFRLFPNLTSCTLCSLTRSQVLFEEFPQSLRVLTLAAFNSNALGIPETLYLQDIPPLLDQVKKWLNTDSTSRDKVIISPRLTLTISKNLWKMLRAGMEAAPFLHSLKIIHRSDNFSPFGVTLYHSPEPQPKVVEVPILDHLDLSEFPSDEVLSALTTLVLPELQSLNILERATFNLKDDTRTSSILRTVKALDITKDREFEDRILTKDMLKEFLVKMPAIRRLAIDSQKISPQIILEGVQGTQLTHLDIKHPIYRGNPLIFSDKLPDTLSSLTMSIMRHSETEETFQKLCELSKKNPQIKIFTLSLDDTYSILASIVNLLDLPLDELHLKLRHQTFEPTVKSRNRQLNTTVFSGRLAQFLASPDAKVRTVFLPKELEFRNFDLLREILTAIQSVPGQDNGVRLREEI